MFVQIREITLISFMLKRYPAEVHTWFFSYPAGGPGMVGVNNSAGIGGMHNDHSQQSSSAVVSNSSSSRNNHYTRIRDL